MAKYSFTMIFPDGTREDEGEIFDTYEEAEDAALYACSCYSLGGEILHLSNPGDYPLSDEDADFEVFEV